MPEPQPGGARLTHVGLAVRSLHDLLPFLRDVLRMEEVENVADSDGAKIIGLEAGGTLVELLESSDAGSPIHRFIERRGPGIHHICLSVDDLDATLERCTAAGIRLIDQIPRVGAEGKRIAFVHPESTGGILIELSEV